MILNIYTREGNTGYIDFQLLSGNEPIDLSDVYAVTLVLEDVEDTSTTFSTLDADPKLFIDDEDNGIVEFRPASDYFTVAKSPYQGNFWVYSTASIKEPVPMRDYIEIEVSSAFGG